MNTTLFLLEFAPLVIYIAVDYFKGFRAGIYAAIVASGLVLAYDYALTGELDQFIIGEALLVVGLGLISLKMNNDRYFKFQPTVVALIFAGLFAYFQLFDQPLLLRFLPHMEKLFASADGASQMLEMMHSSQVLGIFRKLSFAMIWLFLAHAAVMAYAALRLSTRAWFAWRLAIYPALFVLVVFIQLVAS